VPLSRDIKSNLALASRTSNFQVGQVVKRGERKVPKRYLLNAAWLNLNHEIGYYTYYNGAYFPVEFNYETCYWYHVKYDKTNSNWVTVQTLGKEYRLHIPDEDVAPQSDWGKRDGEKEDSDEEAGPSGSPFQSIFDQADNTHELPQEEIDVRIPVTDAEERQEQDLAQLAVHIPSITIAEPEEHTSLFQTPTTVMATQTETRTYAATGERIRSFNPDNAGPRQRPTIPFAAMMRGDPPGRDPPGGDPSGRRSGDDNSPRRIFRSLARGRNDPPRGDPPEDGNDPDDEDPDNPRANQRPIHKSLSGKEPAIFTGDRDKAEAFFLEWRIYQMLNHDIDTIKVPFTRAMLFLSYIKGDRVHEWAATQVRWLGQRLVNGADPNDEYLSDTVENAFETAFRDTMSEQKAMSNFDNLTIEKGNLDEYINRFERLARLLGYDLNSKFVLKKFGKGLVPGLYTSIINGMSTVPDFWTEWVRTAQKYQQKFLLVQSNLEG